MKKNAGVSRRSSLRRSDFRTATALQLVEPSSEGFKASIVQLAEKSNADTDELAAVDIQVELASSGALLLRVATTPACTPGRRAGATEAPGQIAADHPFV